MKISVKSIKCLFPNLCEAVGALTGLAQWVKGNKELSGSRLVHTVVADCHLKCLPGAASSANKAAHLGSIGEAGHFE